MSRFILISFIIFLSVGDHASAQFDFDRYVPSTMSTIAVECSHMAVETIDFNFSSIFYPYSVTLIYEDSIRGVEPITRLFLTKYVKAYAYPHQLDVMYKHELLFSENGKFYWIPTQETLIPSFKEELRRRDCVVVYISVIGATKKNLIILLNEFNKIE